MKNPWAVLAVGLLVCGACRSTPAGRKGAPAQDSIMPAANAGLMEAEVMEWKGPFCGVLADSHRVIQTITEWQALWAQIGNAAPEPPDFSTHFAVAVFLGQRNTGGYGIKWLKPDASGPAFVVRYAEIKPRGLAIMALTQPYAVKVFPKTTAGIKVEVQPD